MVFKKIILFFSCLMIIAFASSCATNVDIPKTTEILPEESVSTQERKISTEIQLPKVESSDAYKLVGLESGDLIINGISLSPSLTKALEYQSAGQFTAAIEQLELAGALVY